MESLSSVVIGESRYPYRLESRCRVCVSSERLAVERAIADGQPYARIEEIFGEPGGINARGIRGHVRRGHLPITAPAVHAVADARSQQIGDAISPIVQGAAANLSLAHAVVDRVRARLDAGDVEPSIRDGLAAAKLIWVWLS